MNQPKMTTLCLNLINTECERVGITSGAAVYYKSNNNVDLPSTLLLLRKKACYIALSSSRHFPAAGGPCNYIEK